VVHGPGGRGPDTSAGLTIEGIREVRTVAELAGLLRQLRRRDARDRGDSQLTYRELAARTGWAHGIIGDYFAGKTLPPTERLDVLVGLLGASPAEIGALATARDRVEEHRRGARPVTARLLPRELPRDVAAFMGRGGQLAELDRMLETSSAVVISAVSGTAGVGKTALAVHWAHRVADRFPDGCLYADLRGYGPDEPARPDSVLAGFLRSLGLAGADLPPGPAELAARYRSALTGRRALIVLDNARSADQVRPLLPGTSTCFVLVTSRDRLTGLVARDGARRIDLDLLPPADATALLRELIGRRADTEPEATAALADRCARLPLALRVAAELATSRPASALADLVAELGDLPKRLDLFDADGDPGTAVREIFSWSYRHLSAEAARMFRLLGLHPGVDFDVPAAAALAGVDAGQARRHVDELARAHLVDQARPGRHRMHDLLRAYAAERAGLDDEPATGAATARLFDHYLHASAAAMDALYPAERGHRPDLAPARVPPPFATPADALAWLDTELPNLVAVAGVADAVGLSGTLWRYLDSGSHHGEALRIHGRAREAARDRGDVAGEVAALGELGRVHGRLGRYEGAIDHLRQALAVGGGAVGPDREASTLNSLAVVYGRLGRYDEAVEHFRRALAIYRRTGNLVCEGKALGNLGIVNAELGNFPQALDHFEQALHLARAVDDRVGEGDALSNLGHVSYLLGRYPDAIDHHRSALSIAREAGDRAGEGRMLASLGVVHTGLDQQTEAFDCLRHALRIQRQTGDRAAQAETLSYLADLHHRTADHDAADHRAEGLRAAVEHHEQAIAIATEIGERGVQTRALNGAGRALLALREFEPAMARHRAAVALAGETGDRLQYAHALDGIGRCLLDSGDRDQATEHLRQALAIYTELGVPDAARVRELLLPDSADPVRPG